MDEQIVLNMNVLNFVLASLIPLAVGLVTKLDASSKLKSILMLVLSILTAVVSYMIDHEGSAQWDEILSVVFATYVTASVTYNNLWRPTGVASAVANVAPSTGLGGDDVGTGADVAPEQAPSFKPGDGPPLS